MALLPDAFVLANSCCLEMSVAVGVFTGSLGVEVAVGGAIGN